jgi:hypothetical protein
MLKRNSGATAVAGRLPAPFALTRTAGRRQTAPGVSGTNATRVNGVPGREARLAPTHYPDRLPIPWPHPFSCPFHMTISPRIRPGDRGLAGLRPDFKSNIRERDGRDRGGLVARVVDGADDLDGQFDCSDTEPLCGHDFRPVEGNPVGPAVPGNRKRPRARNQRVFRVCSKTGVRRGESRFSVWRDATSERGCPRERGATRPGGRTAALFQRKPRLRGLRGPTFQTTFRNPRPSRVSNTTCYRAPAIDSGSDPPGRHHPITVIAGVCRCRKEWVKKNDHCGEATNPPSDKAASGISESGEVPLARNPCHRHFR